MVVKARKKVASGPKVFGSSIQAAGNVQVDYDSISCCSGSDNDCCDGYNRNGTIENIQVMSVDIQGLAKYLSYRPKNTGELAHDTRWVELDYVAGSDIEVYAIERVLVAFKAYDTTAWEVETCGGYYGEEIESVTWQVPGDAQAYLEAICAAEDDNLKVELALLAEYGEILPHLKDRAWSLGKVSLEDIFIPNKTHLVKAELETFPFSPVWQVAGVLVERDGAYHLVDGYHRYNMVKKDLDATPEPQRYQATYLVAH